MILLVICATIFSVELIDEILYQYFYSSSALDTDSINSVWYEVCKTILKELDVEDIMSV